MQPPKQSSYVKSRWEAPIPRCSLPHFVFGAPQDHIESERKLVIDAARPEDRSLTLAEYRSLSVRVAVGLQRLGIQPKDRILCISGNSVCYSSLVMGTIMAGCIFVPGQPGHGDRELERLISVAKPSVILTQRANADTLLQAAKVASSPALARQSIFIFDDNILDFTGESYLGISHWQDMVGAPTEDDWEYPDVQSDEDYHSTIVIMFTSGTTGLPKGVEVSHCSYISSCTGYMKRISLHPDWQQATQNIKDPSPVRILGALGMHHLLGQRSYSVIFPKLGAPVYLLRKPILEDCIDAIEKFKLTDAAVRGSLLTELAKVSNRKGLASKLSSLKRAEGCAAPMPQYTKTMLEGIKIGRVTRAWGLTELGTVTGHDMNAPSTSHSVGELHANYEGKVTDNNDPNRIVDRGTVGDIWIRGPGCSPGYYQNPEATNDAHGADGWFSTGDVGYVDNEGQWYIVDRKKDLIKVRGNHVAPTEIEAILHKHPDVHDAGIVGVAINEDEGPRAYIEPVAHSVLSSIDIHQYLVDKVAPYMYLSGGISFISQMPRNSMGKILRAELRELARRELGDSKGNYHGVCTIS